MERIDAANIGRRVAAYRRSIGFTAEDLARELEPDMTGNAITKLERGHRAQISPGLVVDIARVLGVSPLALLFPLDDPDTEIVIGGVKGTARSFGSWILSESPNAGDVVTPTFRQLIAADQAVGRAIEAEERAADADKGIARQRVNDEIGLRDVLEAHLKLLHSRLFSGEERGRSGADDGERQAAD